MKESARLAQLGSMSLMGFVFLARSQAAFHVLPPTLASSAVVNIFLEGENALSLARFLDASSALIPAPV